MKGYRCVFVYVYNKYVNTTNNILKVKTFFEIKGKMIVITIQMISAIFPHELSKILIDFNFHNFGK